MNECKHDGIATYRLLDGTPAGMWGCTQCAHKFVPIDLAMEARAEKWCEHEAASLKAQSARKMPTMTIDGVAYVEAPEPSGDHEVCTACALNYTDACIIALDGVAENAFGGNCYVRDVIYIRADNSVSDRLQQFGSM